MTDLLSRVQSQTPFEVEVLRLIELVDRQFDNPGFRLKLDIAYRSKGMAVIGLSIVIVGAVYSGITRASGDTFLLGLTLILVAYSLFFNLLFVAESPARNRWVSGRAHFEKLLKTAADPLYLVALVRMRVCLPKGATLRSAYEKNKPAFSRENLVNRALEPMR